MGASCRSSVSPVLPFAARRVRMRAHACAMCQARLGLTDLGIRWRASDRKSAPLPLPALHRSMECSEIFRRRSSSLRSKQINLTPDNSSVKKHPHARLFLSRSSRRHHVCSNAGIWQSRNFDTVLRGLFPPPARLCCLKNEDMVFVEH